MPSIRYYNQTAPFWDWVANMEQTAGDHPLFNAYNPRAGVERETRHDGPSSPPEPHHSEGPPPPPEPHHPSGPPPPVESHHPSGPPPHHRHEGPHHGGPHHGWGRHNYCGGPRRGGFGGPQHGGFPFGRSPHGGWGGFGGNREGPQAFDMNSIAQFLGQQLGLNPEANVDAENSNGEKEGNTTTSKDYTPPADVFDTEDAYVIHISLPGAKKEDVGVNYDADRSELSVAGVIYRPGSEEFLKTLAMDEREVGVFERKVRLGSRARPAMVEIEDISAKMEDGVLIVRVPKLDSEYVDIKKVDIE